jgi:hypothetical protein
LFGFDFGVSIYEKLAVKLELIRNWPFNKNGWETGRQLKKLGNTASFSLLLISQPVSHQFLFYDQFLTNSDSFQINKSKIN